MYRFIVSALPYFTWLMILVTVAALAVQVEEIALSTTTYSWWMDLIFVVFTIVELVLKVGVAVGVVTLHNHILCMVLSFFCHHVSRFLRMVSSLTLMLPSRACGT